MQPVDRAARERSNRFHAGSATALHYNGESLPFEGDGMLSIILSKALLLAADTKITDLIILQQIRPRT